MELISEPDPIRGVSGRTARFAAAGIALAGAGILAVNPIAPALQDFRHQNVQLVSWESLIERTNENLAALMENSNVNTLLDQYSSNQSDYLQLIQGMEDVPLDHRPGLSPRFVTSGFAGINEAIDKMINGADGTVGGDHDRYPGLEQLISQMSESLQNGDAFGAFNHFNIWLLYGLEDIGKAWGPVLSIPALEAMNQSSLLNEFIGPLEGWLFIKQVSDAMMSPMVGAMYQMTENITAAGGGDFGALFNLPVDVLNAFLNGYIVDETGNHFTGLLTEGGIYDLMTNEWAARAAEAITVGTAHLPVNAVDLPDDAAAGADLFDGDFLSSLFDGSLWSA